MATKFSVISSIQWRLLSVEHPLVCPHTLHRSVTRTSQDSRHHVSIELAYFEFAIVRCWEQLQEIVIGVKTLHNLL